MDKQVLAVDQKMNQITNSIQKLSDNLTPKRSRIDHLSGIDVLVKKVYLPKHGGNILTAHAHCS